MSPRLLEALRSYWREYRPPTYLFTGQNNQTQISSTTIQKACKAAALDAKLSRNVSPHTLRHSFATGLLEAVYRVQLVR
jgi:integrase